MGRSPCCEKIGLKKGQWTAEEDQKLRTYIQEHGYGSWRSLSSKAGLERCGKSCRLRWINYLRPDIKRGNFSLQEEQTIIQLHALLGNRWAAIAAHLSKRTDNEIKNYWNTHLKKRLTKMGIDPVTHKPKSDDIGSSHFKNDANISHMAQWESARLETEARLGRDSKLLCSNPYQLSQLDSWTTLTNHQLIINNKTCTQKMPPSIDVLKAWQGAWTTTNKDIRNVINFNGSLESPITSTLNVPNTLGFVENVLVNTWNHKMELPETTTYYHASYISDTSRLPTIMESYTDELVSGNEDDGNNLVTNSLIEQHKNVDQIGTCGDDFGENKNYYWDNMVNFVTSQSRSSMFF